MSLSLRELKEYLISLGGYTVTPKHSQLHDLKLLVDNMMTVRDGKPAGSGSGYYSGVTCNEHQLVSDYNMSLSDIKDLNILGCSCDSVNDTTGYCTSRQGTSNCSCNIDYYCNCQSRSYSPTCNCNSRTGGCDCQDRSGQGTCYGKYSCYCDDVGRPDGCADYTRCKCESRTSNRCSCNSRTTCDCESRTYSSSCSCNTRTGSCSCQSRSGVSSCTCNGRCACNAENRFE